MKITVLDDYQNVVSRLKAIALLEGLDVQTVILTERVANEAALVRRFSRRSICVLRVMITARLFWTASPTSSGSSI